MTHLSPLKTTSPWIPCPCSVSDGPPGSPVDCVHCPCVPCGVFSAFQHPVTQPYVLNMFCSLCPSGPCLLHPAGGVGDRRSPANSDSIFWLVPHRPWAVTGFE